jgi:nitroreductase
MVLTYTVSIVSKPAVTSVPIADLLAERFSPRILDASHEVSSSEILALAEAARWAPSANNLQPWKFAFLKRDTDLFKKVCEVGLTGFNQSWAPNASLLVVAMRQTHKPDGSEFDPAMVNFNLGLACSQLVFQAQSMGLSSHYMTGIIPDQIDQVLEVSGAKTYALIAIGVRADTEGASQELLERENAPRVRKPLSEIITHGI